MRGCGAAAYATRTCVQRVRVYVQRVRVYVQRVYSRAIRFGGQNVVRRRCVVCSASGLLCQHVLGGDAFQNGAFVGTTVFSFDSETF